MVHINAEVHPWQPNTPIQTWARTIDNDKNAKLNSESSEEESTEAWEETEYKPGFDVLLWFRFVSEVFLGIKTTLAVCRCIGSGYRLCILAVRLILFTICLLPGFLKVVFWYYTNTQIVRGVPYGGKHRQMVDIYLAPEGAKRPSPVVIFMTGGAWMIGYRAWGALLARRLCISGVVVFCLDYRNFPTSAESAMDMLEDVNTGIGWVLDNCTNYGGDPRKVHLCGQSAGAHLGCLALLLQCQRCYAAEPNSPLQKAALPGFQGVPEKASTPNGNTAPGSLLQRAAIQQLTVRYPWQPSRIRSFIGVSGPYNLPQLREHFHKVGLTRTSFDQLMSVNGKPAVDELSPVGVVRRSTAAVLAALPEVHLLHGNRDKSIPCTVSEEFAKELQGLGLSRKVDLRIYKDATHTSPLLENPMRGGGDTLTDDILSIVFHKEVQHEYHSLNPDWMINLATIFSPF